MDNQTNTSGGANVGGDVNTGSGDFVGRDKVQHTQQTINYIINLAEHVSSYEADGLIPNSTEEGDFSTIIEAIVTSFKASLDSDRVQAVAFAGEVLGEFFAEWAFHDPHKALPLNLMLAFMIGHICEKLSENRFMDVFIQVEDVDSLSGEVLHLESTNKLWKKYYREDTRFGIAKSRGGVEKFMLVSDFQSQYSRGFGMVQIGEFSVDQVDTLIDGIIADLIRMSAVNARNVHKWVKRRQRFVPPSAKTE